MHLQATNDNSRHVGRGWYALMACVLLFLTDAFLKATRLDGMHILSVFLLIFSSVLAIKALKILAPAEGVWGRVSVSNAVLLALAVVLMQAVWHFIGWEYLIPGQAAIMAVVAAVILAPIFEEVLFRGFGFKVFNFGTDRVAVCAQIVLSAAAFAAWHISYWGSLSLILVFVAGIIFGIARYISGGLLLPIALHMLMNGIAASVLLLI